jgi:hypothetical protein
MARNGAEDLKKLVNGQNNWLRIWALRVGNW